MPCWASQVAGRSPSGPLFISRKQYRDFIRAMFPNGELPDGELPDGELPDADIRRRPLGLPGSSHDGGAVSLVLGHFSERLIDEALQEQQAAVEQRASVGMQQERAALEAIERGQAIESEQSRGDWTNELTHQQAQTLRAAPGNLGIPLLFVRGERASDGLVQAAAEDTKIIRCDGCIHLERELRHRLA